MKLMENKEIFPTMTPMTLIWHPTTQESEAQLREPAERSGPTWGGRLRRTTHPPDYYASNIDL